MGQEVVYGASDLAARWRSGAASGGRAARKASCMCRRPARVVNFRACVGFACVSIRLENISVVDVQIGGVKFMPGLM